MVKVYITVLFLVGVLGSKVAGYRNTSVRHVRDNPAAWQTPDFGRGAAPCTQLSIYTCEVPPNATAPSDPKRCNYRNIDYQQQVYRWVAGRGCLVYTPEFLFVGGENAINLNAACAYDNLIAPCLEIAKENGTCGCFPYDPAFPAVVEAVRAATVPLAHGRWERCYEAAADCCARADDTDELSDEEVEFIEPVSRCPSTFDGWTCWDSTDANTQAFEVCSEFAYSNAGPTCNHYSSKTCNLDGVWEIQSDYSSCSVTTRLINRYQVYIVVLVFSIASCVPAIFIFLFYKRLRIPRVALHRNLIIAIVFRNIVVTVSRSEIYMEELTVSGETAMSSHSVACRALAVAERVAGNAVFVCMLVEGVYLHRLIVAVFRRKLNLMVLYGVGAAIAILPVVAWAVLMSHYDDHSCWLVYTLPHIQWILDVPRIAILSVNTVLFLDILRVLLTKVRNKENANQLNTAKATLFLMPLFGVQFLLTAFRPSTSNCAAEQAYYYVTYTVEGLQGFIVALLFCYVNREVQSLLKATYMKTESAVMSRVRSEAQINQTRTASDNSFSRRFTGSTSLDIYQKDKLSELKFAQLVKLQSRERIAEVIEPPIYDVVTIGMVNGCFKINNLGKEETDKPPQEQSDDSVSTSLNSVALESPVNHPNEDVTTDPQYETCQTQRNAKKEFVESLPDHSYMYAAATTTFKPVNDVINESVDNRKGAQLNNDNEFGSEDSFDSDEDTYTSVTEEMLNEILQKLSINDVTLNAKALCPNRSDGDDIVFQ